MERTSNPCDQSDSVDSRGVGRIPPSSVRVSMRVVVVLVAQNSPPQNYKGDVGLVATIYLRRTECEVEEKEHSRRLCYSRTSVLPALRKPSFDLSSRGPGYGATYTWPEEDPVPISTTQFLRFERLEPPCPLSLFVRDFDGHSLSIVVGVKPFRTLSKPFLQHVCASPC